MIIKFVKLIAFSLYIYIYIYIVYVYIYIYTYMYMYMYMYIYRVYTCTVYFLCIGMLYTLKNPNLKCTDTCIHLWDDIILWTSESECQRMSFNESQHANLIISSSSVAILQHLEILWIISLDDLPEFVMAVTLFESFYLDVKQRRCAFIGLFASLMRTTSVTQNIIILRLILFITPVKIIWLVRY